MNDACEGLAFFNELSGMLDVQLSEAPVRVAEHLLNVRATPSARVVTVSLKVRVFENGHLRDLTDEEWTRVVLRSPRIRMRSTSDEVVEHIALNGETFTVRELAAAIAETERIGREKSRWLGGVDVHHVFFEGIELEANGVWTISWGS